MSATRRMIFAGTIEDNLLYGLKYRPQRPRPTGEDALSRAASASCTRPKRSGNSPHDPQADWVDYAAAGIEEPSERVTSLDPRAGAGARWTATCSAWACAARSRRAPTPSSRTGCSRRGGPCSSGCSDERRPVAPGRAVRPRALQHQRQPRREPAVRLAGRQPVRPRADRRPALRAARRSRRPGCSTISIEVGYQPGADHARAVRRPAARPRVFPPVQLHRARGSAGLSQPAGAGRSGPARPPVGATTSGCCWRRPSS